MDAPKNKFLPNGHNYQQPILPLYLPGNGGLLFAAAMMAAGWHGGPNTYAPGFTAGDWAVRWEGLLPALENARFADGCLIWSIRSLQGAWEVAAVPSHALLRA